MYYLEIALESENLDLDEKLIIGTSSFQSLDELSKFIDDFDRRIEPISSSDMYVYSIIMIRK